MSHEHQPDGRLRLAAVLLVSVAATLAQSTAVLALMLLFSVLAAIAVIAHAAVSLASVLQRMLVINIFVLWIWLTVPIDWTVVELHSAGVELATKMSLRINLISLAALLLLAGMNGIDLARSAVALGVSQKLGSLLAMAVRQVKLLGETQHRLQRAMKARAYRLRFSWHSLRVSAQLVAWLIVHALLRAERIDLGLKARGLTTTGWPLRQLADWRSLPRSEWYVFGAVAAALGIAATIPLIWGLV